MSWYELCKDIWVSSGGKLRFGVKADLPGVKSAWKQECFRDCSYSRWCSCGLNAESKYIKNIPRVWWLLLHHLCSTWCKLPLWPCVGCLPICQSESLNKREKRKAELFPFLTREAICLPVAKGKELYATDGTGVIYSPAASSVACLAPCLQEEADRCGCIGTQWLLLAEQLLMSCYSSNLCHNDSPSPDSPCLSRFHWVWHSLNLLVEERRQPGILGSLSQRSLMLCRNSWPCQARSVKDQGHWFVVLMYYQTSECMELNEARKHLFSQKSRTLENIPPTQAALKQQIK